MSEIQAYREGTIPGLKNTISFYGLSMYGSGSTSLVFSDEVRSEMFCSDQVSHLTESNWAFISLAEGKTEGISPQENHEKKTAVKVRLSITKEETQCLVKVMGSRLQVVTDCKLFATK